MKIKSNTTNKDLPSRSIFFWRRPLIETKTSR